MAQGIGDLSEQFHVFRDIEAARSWLKQD